VLENKPVQTFHDAKCEGLTNSTDFCNFVADGANLCAEAHSEKWWDFVACMYSAADPNGDKDHDAKSPLAHTDSFDQQVAICAKKLPDYDSKDLFSCIHGSEGAALRKASAAKTPDSKFAGPVWVEVAGKVVASPHGPALPRNSWIMDVIKAVCAAYTGAEPAACTQADVIV